MSRTPSHQQIGGGNDKHRQQRRGEHAADHRRGDAAHHFGAGAGPDEDREQAREDTRDGGEAGVISLPSGSRTFASVE